MVLKLPITSKIKIAKGTWEMRFDLQGKEFKFKPGQYIRINLPEVDLNHPKGNHREFSIINSPTNITRLTIALRESDSDFKQALLAHSIGDLIKINGPFGDLMLPKNLSSSIVMIAGGMGITPFLSMLMSLDEQNADIQVILLYVNSKRESTPYLNFLETMKKKLKQFNFVHVQSRLTEKDLASYFEKFDKQSFSASKEAKIMLAGPPTMVRDIRLSLLDLGFQTKQIFLEEFTGY